LEQMEMERSSIWRQTCMRIMAVAGMNLFALLR